MESGINKIYQSTASCFNSSELAMLWRENDIHKVSNRANYYTRTVKLLNPRKGIYCKQKYDKFELAAKVFVPSYISLMTVLGIEGINFQYHSNIYVISYLSREIKIDNQEYIFKKIKDEVLFNPAGIIQKDHYAIASKERALLDTLYLIPNYYFDALDIIDWDKSFEIAKIYKKKSLIQKLDFWYRNYKDSI